MLLLLLLSLTLLGVNLALGDVVIGPWERSATEVVDQIRKNYQQSKPENVEGLSVVKSDYASLGRFADRDDPYMALIVREYPDAHAKSRLASRFPSDSPQPDVFFIGQRKLAVVVHRRNRVQSITLDQLGTLLAGSDQPARWDVLDGGHRPVVLYDEGALSWSRQFKGVGSL